MAHLEVEPKPSRPWWVWLLIILLLVALAALFMNKCGSDKNDSGTDSLRGDSLGIIAGTEPDWKAVDFKSAKIVDKDISDQDIIVSGTNGYTIYTLGENILFASGQAQISEEGKRKLKQIGEVISRRFQGSNIAVFGSADATGPAHENASLGHQRAQAVSAWLKNDSKVSSDNISIQTLGESEPVATNETADGRKQNRNVAIVIYNNK